MRKLTPMQANQIQQIILEEIHAEREAQKSMKTSLRRSFINEAIQHKPMGETEKPNQEDHQEGWGEYDEVLLGLEDRLRTCYKELMYADGADVSSGEIEEMIEETISGFIEVMDHVGLEMSKRHEQVEEPSSDYPGDTGEPIDLPPMHPRGRK